MANKVISLGRTLSVDTTVSTSTVPCATSRTTDKSKTTATKFSSSSSSSSSSTTVVPSTIIDHTVRTVSEIGGETLLNNSIKLVVFDFDQCVLGIHSYALRITPDQVWKQRNVPLDFCDYTFFITFIPLLLSLGIDVAIASFGRYEVIQAYLDKAFGVQDPLLHPPSTNNPNPNASILSSLFSLGRKPTHTTTDTTSSSHPGDSKVRYFTRTNISTPSTVGGTDGWSLQGGKNQQLTALLQQYDTNPSSTLFFDDDLNNIRHARDIGFCHSIHCPTGFDYDAWFRAINALSVGPDSMLAFLSGPSGFSSSLSTTTTTTNAGIQSHQHSQQPSPSIPRNTPASRMGIAAPPTIEINDFIDPLALPTATLSTVLPNGASSTRTSSTSTTTTTNGGSTSFSSSSSSSSLPSLNNNDNERSNSSSRLSAALSLGPLPIRTPLSASASSSTVCPPERVMDETMSTQHYVPISPSSSSSSVTNPLPIIDTVMDTGNGAFTESETPRNTNNSSSQGKRFLPSSEIL